MVVYMDPRGTVLSGSGTSSRQGFGSTLRGVWGYGSKDVTDLEAFGVWGFGVLRYLCRRSVYPAGLTCTGPVTP